MDLRRLKLLGLISHKLKCLSYLFRKRDLRDFYSYIWTHLYSRDSGLALLDPIWRRFPERAPYPKMFELEITTRCHLKCIMCEHTYWKEKPMDMSFEQFKHICDQFPVLHWIGITGIGSSFLHKDFMKMLRYLKEEKHTFVEFFDHFHLVPPEKSKELVEMHIDKIVVSLDAATKETYEKIRVGSNWEQVIENVKALIWWRKKYKSYFPELWFHYIITQENVHEILPFIDVVNEIAKEDPRHPVMIFWTNVLDFEEIDNMKPALSEDIKKAANEKMKELGIYTFWNENTTRDKPACYCTKWTEPFVLVSGDIQGCCGMNMVNDRQSQVDNSYGNLFEQDFRDMWKSPKLVEFRRMIHENRTNPACRNCRLYRHPDIEREKRENKDK